MNGNAETGKKIDEINGFSSEILAHIQAATSSCAVANLRKASRVITQLFDDALEPLGLTATQSTLLSNIALYEPATINELADKLLMNRTTLTRDLKPLERESLVKIETGKHDQRTRQVTLTTKGRQTVLEAAPLRQEAQDIVEETLGKEQFQTLLKLLAGTFQLVRNE
jgi:DNA-binding MarR family transcriptional regulator